MNKFTFILGGIRSGKSAYALELAKKNKKRVVFIATAAASDNEMKKRIEQHQKSRPKSWKTIEEGIDIDLVLLGLNKKYEIILIDCLGIFISNLLSKDFTQQQIKNKVEKLIKVITIIDIEVVVVSNEVGTSLVSFSPLGRQFQDLLGFTNQAMAKAADRVIFTHAGIPIDIKSPKSE
ncbi:MAG: bifunctional adenosylcobinamide kinase/adenosylcobinamide-phosphate guanylyltransferase [Candidatus Omnitrophota bacterium]